MLLAFALAGTAAGAQNIPRWLHRVAAAVSSAQRLAQLPHCHRPGTLGSGGSDTQAVPQNPKKTDCKDTFGNGTSSSTGLKACLCEGLPLLGQAFCTGIAEICKKTLRPSWGGAGELPGGLCH